LPLESERALGAQVELIPARFEFRIRRDEIQARRLGLRARRKQNRRRYDCARALTVREYARRHRPIHAEGWILRRVAVALAGEADEDAADFDVPGQRVVRRQLEVVAERRLAGGTVLLERFTGLIAEPQLVRIVLITGDRHQPIVAPAAEHVRAARQPGV